MQEVVGAYKDSSEPKKVQSTGLHIAGQKYIVIKADDTSLYGKKVGFDKLHLHRVSRRIYIPDLVLEHSEEKFGDFV